MNKSTNAPAPNIAEREYHLVCSSGGSRAILASAGVLLACEQAGIKRFKSVGGVSGGSIPTALYASGMTAKECVAQAMEIDFASLLTRRASIFKILFAYFMQRRNEKVRPINCVLTSERVGDFVESYTDGAWPKGYWTVGIADKSQVLFSDAGVFELFADGQVKVLSQEPGPLGIAIRASIAVPGIISPVQYNGQWLFDGALGPEGRAPFSVPTRLYSAPTSSIIVCDVGDDTSKSTQRITRLWKWICGDDCVPEIDEPPFEKAKDLVIVRPHITGFRSLQFTLKRDTKWRAVMAGFVDSTQALHRAGILTGDKLCQAEEISCRFAEILAEADVLPDGVLTRRVEALLLQHDLL